MPSLLILLWMSATSLATYVAGPRGPAEDGTHLAAQGLILIAVMAQAGYMESGEPTGFRRHLQVLALAGFVANLAWHHGLVSGLLL